MIGLGAASLGRLNALIAHAPPAAAPSLGGCPMFPSDNIWNTAISSLPVAANSTSYIASIGTSGHLHPDFGAGVYAGVPIGIPYIVVPANQPGVPVSFQYSDESDKGPYPIPVNAPIEGGSGSTGDRHVLIVQSGVCKLFETYSSYPQNGGSSWTAGSGAIWNLNSDALRPSTWTSADAAGLPILPGLVRYDEVASGTINHALRFTIQHTRDTFVWPARHQASSLTGASYPPMGLRLRLKASVNISSFSAQNRVILTALKQYGMIVADNGSNWYISGAPDDRWNNDDLHQLGQIPGSDFEVVDTSALEISPNSGQARQVGTPTPTVSPSPTISPTAALLVTPTSPANGGTGSGQTGSASTDMRTLLILILGGVGILLAVILGIRRRLQEVKRLAAEAQQNQDSQAP